MHVAPRSAVAPHAQGNTRRSHVGLAAACPHSGLTLFMDSTTRQTARLRIVTPNPSSRPDDPMVIGPDVVLDCEGGYTCECSGCQREREALQRRGVRSLRPTYVKRNRAA